MLNKKGAEESNVIIFIILALAVVGLVVFFSWNFFSTGSRLIDGNDPSVAIAVESCKYEVARQPDAYCNSAHSVRIKGGGEMIVSCYFLDTAVRRNALEEVSGKPSCADENQAFKESQCNLIKNSGASNSDWEEIIVDGEKCDDILKGVIITGGVTFEKPIGETTRVYIKNNKESHDIKPLSIDVEKQTATIEIRSTPLVIELNIGEEKKLDLNSDRTYDFYIILDSISGEKVKFKVKEIKEKIVSGIGDDSIQQAEILEFKGSGNFEVLSEEECLSGLEQRKTDLEIPDKLCYWQAMTEVYDEKCDNLNKEQISQIFEKKAEYRKLNNPDWPSLNTDGDFCVDVVYDCGEWDVSKKDKAKIGGFCNYGSALHSELKVGIYINPYLAMDKLFAQNTILLHEGLHAVQNRLTSNTHVAEGANYGGMFEQYNTMGNVANQMKVFEIIDEMKQYRDILNKKEDEVSEKIQSEIELIISKESISEQDRQKIEGLYKKISDLSIGYTASIPRMGVYEPAELEKIFLDEIKTPLMKYNLWDAEAENAYNKLLELNKQSYLLTYEYKVKGYVGSKIEVDPRLSEVQRWWLEKTAPNCEIIYTKEKAKEVLDLFLAEKNLPDEYKWSQQDLGLLLYVYRGTEYEDDVYNDLINRLPGLAANTDYNSNEMYA